MTSTSSTPLIDSYLRYLPAVYATSSPQFLYEYLRIFQKILTGIADKELDGRRGIAELLAADVIGNLFYPRLSFLFPDTDTSFIPPISGAKPDQEQAILADLNSYIGVPGSSDPLAEYLPQTQHNKSQNQDAILSWLNDFLLWLGTWINLELDNSWSVDKKRNVMAQMPAMYRQRGSLQGMSMLCNLLLDLPLTVSGSQYDAQGNETGVSGTISVVFSNPQAPNIVCSASAKDSKAFILHSNYQRGMAVLGGYLPWLFEVKIVLPNANKPGFILSKNTVQQVQTLQAQLLQLLQKIKPAATDFRLLIVPSMQLQDPAYATNLGNNTLLGDIG